VFSNESIQELAGRKLFEKMGCRQTRIISFIAQADVIKEILQHLGLWEESHAPPDTETVKREITFDPSHSQLI